MNGGSNRFNSLHTRLQQNIYGTTKGKLRLELITEDIKKIILPKLDQSACLIDIGCGEARISELFILGGYTITLLDQSGEMLGLVKKRLLTNGVDLARVRWRPAALQTEIPLIPGGFDLIILHAVIEWLDDPWEALAMISKLLVRGGMISLAYYNRNSLIYRNLLQGNFRKINRDDWKESSTGLTPVSPIDPQKVKHFFESHGFKLIHRRGIRCFYDFMREPIKQARSYQDVLDMESKYSLQEPFMSLGRYQHEIWKNDK